MPEIQDARAATQAAPADVRGGLPVLPPLAALVEIAVLVVLPALLDLFVVGFPALNETQPHFFWLPVLLLTLQYGSGSGLLAAGTAIVLASLLGWPEQEIGENHFSYMLRIWLQPVLWIATAVILGQFRLRQIERKQLLGQEVISLSEQRRALAEHATSLRERCDRLERILATREATDAQALLTALGGTQANSPDLAKRALDDALSLAFGESNVSVLVLEDGALHPAHRHASTGAPPPKPISPTGPLHRAVVGDGLALNVLNPGSEHHLAGHGVAAVPIFGAAGTITGAILLETCSPQHLDSATATRLAAIAAVISGRLMQSSADLGPARVPQSESSPEPAFVEPPWRRVRWQGARHRAAGARLGRKA